MVNAEMELVYAREVGTEGKFLSYIKKFNKMNENHHLRFLTCYNKE